MKTVLCVALLLGAFPAFGYAQGIDTVDVPVSGGHCGDFTDRGFRAVGDWIRDIDLTAITGDSRCLGVEFDGTDWWVTGAFDKVACKLYQISYRGVLINSFEQFNTDWGWRDLAWDGTYLYASDSYDIEQIDPVTGAITGVTIPSPISPARALAYDPATDSFWTADFGSSIYNVNRDGTFSLFPNPTGLQIYGMAMDDVTDILWLWSQTNTARADAFDPRTGTFTGDTWDGTAGAGGAAGGCCIFDDKTHGMVFVGAKQDSPGNDHMSVFDLGIDPKPQVDIKCNGLDAGVVLSNVQNVVLTIDVQARSGAGVPVDLWCIIKRTGGKAFSYDGSWHAGTGHPAHSGGLFDIDEKTVLDRTVPLGSFTAYLAIDTQRNGNLDMGSIVRIDSVDFRVEPLQGFVEDFEDGTADGWIPDGPHWSVGGGVYFLDTPYFDDWLSYYSIFEYTDFTCSADMRMIDTGSTSGFYCPGLYFRSDGTLDNCYSLRAGYSGTVFIEKYVNGVDTMLASGSPASFVTGVGNWNNLAADVDGTTIDVYINGVLEFTVSDSSHSTGFVGLRGQGSGSYDLEYEFDNAIVTL